jgi:ribosome maturation factor RimP
MAEINRIREVIEPVVRALDLGLYDVEIAGSGRARVVRVLVDRPGGVDLDTIAAATEAVSPVLDAPLVDAWLSGPYALEVSSPGLERPLRTPEHFQGAIGETISVKTRAGEAPARRDRGVLESAGAASFELVVDGGSRATIAYDDVIQARTVFEWGPAPKSGKRTHTDRQDANREVVRP